MRASDPTTATKRADRRLCPLCETTPAGCRSWRWLHGSFCCIACTGDHDGARSAADPHNPPAQPTSTTNERNYR